MDKRIIYTTIVLTKAELETIKSLGFVGVQDFLNAGLKNIKLNQEEQVSEDNKIVNEQTCKNSDGVEE